MSHKDYYYSRRTFPGFGKHYFLKVLREAPAGSPPYQLVGSIVECGGDGLLGLKDFPVPDHFYSPEIVLKKCEQIGIPDGGGKLVLESGLAGLEFKMKINAKAGVDVDAKFPSLPVGLGLDLDYEKITDVTLKLGVGARIRSIPLGFLHQLYFELGGIEDRIAQAMNEEHMIVHSVLLAKNFDVHVRSQRKFEAEFVARANALNEVGGAVKFAKTSDTEYKAVISGADDYLVAVAGVKWEDLDE